MCVLRQMTTGLTHCHLPSHLFKIFWPYTNLSGLTDWLTDTCRPAQDCIADIMDPNCGAEQGLVRKWGRLFYRVRGGIMGAHNATDVWLSHTKWHTHVFVVYKFHKNKLAVRSLGVRHVLERTTQLLNRNVLVSHRVISRTETRTHTEKMWQNSFAIPFWRDSNLATLRVNRMVWSVLWMGGTVWTAN